MTLASKSVKVNGPWSNSLSSICLSTFLVSSRCVMRDWYLPSCAVVRDPMANAGPFTGTAAATGADVVSLGEM